MNKIFQITLYVSVLLLGFQKHR